MQHLNYCRQALSAGVFGRGDWQKDWEDGYGESFRDTVLTSHKFIVPNGGKIISDTKFSGILSTEALTLPFEKTIIEVNAALSGDGIKCVLIMREFEKNDIHIVPVFYADVNARWIIMPSFGMLIKDEAVCTRNSHALSAWIEEIPSLKDSVNVYANIVADFLNALACRNVHIEKSPAKATKQGKKVKAALPFDDYHFLTVDVPGKAGVRGEGMGGSHRSPREHLRRGHIRRLESGPIWVNACVVNAGVGSKVGKSYLLRKSA